MFESVRVSSRGTPDAVVLGQFKGEELDAGSAGEDVNGWGDWACKQPDATGDLGRVANILTDTEPTRVFVVGLGLRSDFEVGSLRTVAGALGRAAAGARLGSLDVRLAAALGSLDGFDQMARAGQALGEGLGLIGWGRDQYKGTGTSDPAKTGLAVRSGDTVFGRGLARGLGLAEAANAARTLSETPPNICTPDYVASQARRLARGTGLRVSVIRGQGLADERLTGLMTVGAASENAPCLVRIEWPGSGGSRTTQASKTGRGGRAQKPIVLIGKTMTYDSGGLSIKVNNGMRGMKRDKDGGCAVFGAMHAVATVVKPRRPVVALLCCAENSISDEAYRPDDILTFRNGVTVEVTNTDAEGRLVLADGLCWACEKENPAAIVDLATLTGGVVVALGSVYAGLWCDDDGLRDKLMAAADASGERLWRLPHHAEYNDLMRSPVADIVNSAPVREAHPIQGAAFLSSFVDKKVPWAHIDIAGVHATDKPRGPFDPGPTGFGTRLLAELIEAF